MEPKSVIFQPCQVFLKKFDSKNFWIPILKAAVKFWFGARHCFDDRLPGQTLNFVWIMAVFRQHHPTHISKIWGEEKTDVISTLTKGVKVSERRGDRTTDASFTWWQRERERQETRQCLTRYQNDTVIKTGIMRAQTITIGGAPNGDVLIRETPTQRDRERDELLHRGL